MDLAFVHGILPVHIEQSLYHGCDLVHIVDVESDNPESDNVRYVRKGMVLRPLQLKLAPQGRFLLYPGLY